MGGRALADSWIKMRASLLTNPKVIRTARALLQAPVFRDWFGITLRHDCVTDRHVGVTERHDSSVTNVGANVTDRHAQRHAIDVTIVTRIVVGASLPLWSQANECAGEDGLLEGATLFEIDTMSGVPGLGHAMESVGWIEVLPNDEGVRFINFNEHNTVGKERSTGAKTAAQRQADRRRRLKEQAAENTSGNVTERHVTERDEERDASRDTVTTEKRRVEKRRKKGAKAPTSADDLPTWMGELVALYHEVLPELPGVRVMDAGREQALRDFRDWVLHSKRPDGSPRATTDDEMLVWSRDYFERARLNDFIMGRGARSPEHKNWRCSIEFLLSSKGVKKVVEETAEIAA